jgi:C4-dicarboxylate-specific signal transduction histidine kinase
MLGELAASIAHEVNQPLAAISTNGEACLRWLNRPQPELDEARSTVTSILESWSARATWRDQAYARWRGAANRNMDRWT